MKPYYATQVFHDEDRGLAITTLFGNKDRCKAIPGARWDKELKAWRYPFTPFAAKAIAAEFPPGTCKWSDIAEKLLLESQAIEDSARHKTAATLPDIPVQKVPAWHHQKQCFWFAKNLPGVMIAFDMGCISGDSILHVNRGGLGSRLTARRVFERLSGQGNGRERWNPDVATYMRGRVGADGRLGRTKILAAFNNGFKPVVRLTLSNGASLRCTADHDIVTPTGKVKAQNLRVGDAVIVQAETSGGRLVDKDGYVRIRQDDGSFKYEHRLVMESAIGRRLEAHEVVHHGPAGKTVNALDNLTLHTSQTDHAAHHADHRDRDEMGRFQPGMTRRARIASRPGYVRLPQTTATVVECIPDGIDEVFDFTVESDYHDYVANGIVVGNTGKSRIAIDLIQNREHWATLILCPKSVIDVWPTQFERHAVREYTLITGNEGSVANRVERIKRDLSLSRARLRPAVVVLNYEAAWREPMDDFLLDYKWDCVVLDESHRIKSASGKASKFCSRLGDTVPYRICLTGTPMPHKPTDIYAQYRFLDKGIFGTSFVNFRARYAVMGGYGNHTEVSYQNQDEMHEKMYQIAMRVNAEDVQDLPEAMDIIRTCKLSASARAIYDSVDKEFVAEVGSGMVTVTNALTKLLRLQQITSGFVTMDRSDELTQQKAHIQEIDTAKAELLLDILEDLHPKEPVAIFCRFRTDLDTIHSVGASLGRKVLELAGRGVNQLAEWQADTKGDTPILAVQIQSGGLGVDLTRARYQIFYSLGYSLGDYLQARKRCHRPGQTRSVKFIHLVAEHTKDADVYKALEQRLEVVESILDTTRARLAADVHESHPQPAAV